MPHHVAPEYKTISLYEICGSETTRPTFRLENIEEVSVTVYSTGFRREGLVQGEKKRCVEFAGSSSPLLTRITSDAANEDNAGDRRPRLAENHSTMGAGWSLYQK